MASRAGRPSAPSACWAPCASRAIVAVGENLYSRHVPELVQGGGQVQPDRQSHALAHRYAWGASARSGWPRAARRGLRRPTAVGRRPRALQIRAQVLDRGSRVARGSDSGRRDQRARRRACARWPRAQVLQLASSLDQRDQEGRPRRPQRPAWCESYSKQRPWRVPVLLPGRGSKYFSLQLVTRARFFCRPPGFLQVHAAWGMPCLFATSAISIRTFWLIQPAAQRMLRTSRLVTKCKHEAQPRRRYEWPTQCF
jgi:hypothetical protein